MVNATDAIILTVALIFGVSGLALAGTAALDGSKVSNFACSQPDIVRDTLQLLPTVPECTFTDDPDVEPEDVYRLRHQITIKPTTTDLIEDTSFSYETEVMEDSSPQFSFFSRNLGFFTPENYKVEYRLLNDTTGRVLTTDAQTFTDEAVEGLDFKDVTFTTPRLPDGRYRLDYIVTAENEGLLGTETVTDELSETFLVPGSEGVVN